MDMLRLELALDYDVVIQKIDLVDLVKINASVDIVFIIFVHP